ncbi:3-oxoadipate enol-lactonase [Marinobacter sp. 71-i]|uniref:3-oxoadipate enol-lactonase n=1 Tax=Marinobacter iranensis TaxID=2962607 RepID=A0ABT5YBQ4_9GAMM|nr:3-oxoadipate enol-lactonase [Marinobacter iranensis]MDF0751089.1 3-oxoadipate enol-lactonase [Marinobacter iranensis]
MCRTLTSLFASFALFTPMHPTLTHAGNIHPGPTGTQSASTNIQGQTPSFFTAGDETRIAYRLDGPADKPVLVLSNSIGTDLHMWDAQVPELTRHFRVLRYDMRGHGASGVPSGAYSIGRFGRDVIELLDSLGIERAHFLGLSLGGYVGQWLGIHTPERIGRLILSNTAAYLGPAEQWDEAIAAVLEAEDMKETAERFLLNWFPARLLEAESPVVERFRNMLLATDRQGLAGSWAIVRDTDMRRTISLISRPTLIIAGEHDPVTTLEHSELMAGTIPEARLVVLPATHMTNVQYPAEFLEAVVTFLTDSGGKGIHVKAE